MEFIKKIVKKLFTACSVYTVFYNAAGGVIYSDDPLVPVVVKLSSIWKTVEADAWSRNFKYLEYVGLCVRMKIEPQSDYAYDKIYQALQSIMDNDPQMQPSDDSENIALGDFQCEG